MPKNSRHLLNISLLFFFIGITSALYCYQCDSRFDVECKEFLDSHDKAAIRPTLCTVDSAEFCIKTTGVWGGVVGTTRFCTSRDMFNQCQYVSYKDHDRIYRACIYTCSGDGCNHASSNNTPNFVLLLLIAIVATLFVRN